MIFLLGICVSIGLLNIPLYTKPILPIFASPQIINFHTPVLTEGISLPQHITNNITVGPDQGTILINSLITVAPNAKLTILPGTTLAVAEFGGLSVFGSLQAAGTLQQPITFISNEQNEANKHWVGILLQNGSTAEINYVSIHHASPAISCAPESHTTISHISFLLDAVGFAHTLFACQVIQSGVK